MDMPAFNVKEPISFDQVIKSNVKQFVEHSFDTDEKIEKTTKQILSNPAVKEAVQKLAKE
ncbi:hypothetical protein [Loigolactobacillus zhaoyuanensis]|uniref:Uncharacterized protein n=1 Tax=Loigolactobacillus zhaoyuanensis TaxID=2486017 RepID=A0ABW8UC55_9LACO